MITIVTGLPRSGTSMMMQMLAAGGMPIVSDGVRRPDEWNARGYLEHESATDADRLASWLPSAAEGRAVKVVVPHVAGVPQGLNCRAVLMTRDVSAVVESQNRMAGVASSSARDEELAFALERMRQDALSHLLRIGVPTLAINYDECLGEPRGAAACVTDHVSMDLNLEAMVRAVAPRMKTSRGSIRAVSLRPPDETAARELAREQFRGLGYL